MPLSLMRRLRKNGGTSHSEGTQAKVEIVYQTLEGLHEACPNHTGDWYFSGDYPTPGGVKLVNQAFIDYIEKVYQF